MPVRTVLIPLDGADAPIQIVRIVRTYIEPDEVRLVLLRSVELASGPSDSAHEQYIPAQRTEEALPDSPDADDAASTLVQTMRETLLCEVQRQLAADVENLRGAGYTVTGEVRFGDLVQLIVEYVAEKHVALVALATPAYTGNGKPLPDSLADKIVRGLSVPVLLMRTNGS